MGKKLKDEEVLGEGALGKIAGLIGVLEPFVSDVSLPYLLLIPFGFLESSKYSLLIRYCVNRYHISIALLCLMTKLVTMMTTMMMERRRKEEEKRRKKVEMNQMTKNRSERVRDIYCTVVNPPLGYKLCAISVHTPEVLLHRPSLLSTNSISPKPFPHLSILSLIQSLPQTQTTFILSSHMSCLTKSMVEEENVKESKAR